jgi:hypothetical protein
MNIGHRAATHNSDLLHLRQFVGMVNDHVVGYFRYAEVKKAGCDQMDNVMPAVRRIAITSLVMLMAF